TRPPLAELSRRKKTVSGCGLTLAGPTDRSTFRSARAPRGLRDLARPAARARGRRRDPARRAPRRSDAALRRGPGARAGTPRQPPRASRRAHRAPRRPAGAGRMSQEQAQATVNPLEKALDQAAEAVAVGARRLEELSQANAGGAELSLQ